MVASPHMSYMCFFLFFHHVMLAGHTLGHAVDAGEGGLGAATLARAPQLQWWGEIFLMHYKFFFLNFEHAELSLEGSRSTFCTHVVKLVVMVASPHLSYMYFFLFLHQVMMAGHALGQAMDAGEGVLGAETLPGAPQLQ
jgi:hypothetical protein